jgi:hypothetical protein
VNMRLDPAIGSEVELEFDVTGATEAIAKVYELCQDTPPT